MDFDYQWLLLALPAAFFFGWVASRLDLRQLKRDDAASPQAYFKGLNLLLNEQQDKAIDAFIEAVQHDPQAADLHFALGNLFRRRGEYERAIRVHQHLLARGDLQREARERAQHALAQDFMKAGLFDRAEEAFKALEGTAFATDARLALLSLYERSRNWHPAIDVARQLESGGTGSFSQRMAHHWCEIAQEADARGRDEEAQQALDRAREAAPQAARPLVMQGQRLLRQQRHAGAMQVWDELMALQPAAFSLVAKDYAQCAQILGQVQEARTRLAALYERAPSVAVLSAMNSLQDDPAQRRQAIMTHIAQQPSLSAAQDLIRERLLTHVPLDEPEIERLQQALATAAKPLQRYRCAACGFESQHHFWQCPGCHGWDTYPPRRLEEH
ncbi:lipopolysaccharide assembly protein LapB [Aquabacterium fontiphilum]|jgi:lipopolysaccharide biosynthesis regulator YciM|uniref:lipopolysaccharide assembly protein LapB n=1 Tax=Aquabacterium fontiphilum TaxID=450365 RepID=UPI00137816E6|nr:lipopolysaccharide assembly protein LapB [Aquabacterium fontiphilum]NBD19598.1 lipopolysaccharide assembly protein LapB [Aquabacterium fontiphilum]